ncbi:MAG: class II aldolase/adducin family protein [Actinomycetota bacterium]|nr:class II aldolase/adducin family protein [Actinomycetota bacterium]
MPGGNDVDAAREAVASAARRLAAERLVLGTSGNVSLRTGDAVAVSPTGAKLADLEPEQVAVVDLDGEQVEGTPAPTSELGLHLGIHAERGEGAVVHAHSRFATAIACVLDELPVVHYEMLRFGGPVRVARYATFGSDELAAAVHEALDGRTAALMANHGVVTAAGDMDSAVELALLLEWACEVYWRAAQVGEPRTLGDDELRAVVEQVAALGYGRTRER